MWTYQKNQQMISNNLKLYGVFVFSTVLHYEFQEGLSRPIYKN